MDLCLDVPDWIAYEMFLLGSLSGELSREDFHVLICKREGLHIPDMQITRKINSKAQYLDILPGGYFSPSISPLWNADLPETQKTFLKFLGNGIDTDSSKRFKRPRISPVNSCPIQLVVQCLGLVVLGTVCWTTLGVLGGLQGHT